MLPAGVCPTLLLSDVPTSQDAFGHRAVARAIADLISTELGGKCIGLTGSWGSGKSSVVEILREEMGKRQDIETELFVFDAWAHQGDTLRRSFLEQLIQRLQQKGWLSDEPYWRRKREELSLRLQITDTTTTPILTAWGSVFAVALLLMPLGFQLWLKYLSDPTLHEIIPIVGMTLTMFPFLLVIATYFWWRPYNRLRPWTKAFWFTHRDPDVHKSIWALFLNKQVSKITSNTIRTPDPTSIEFQTVFHEVLVTALRDAPRKLLIVLDNLDRVDTEDALKIWSTLRTFFDFANTQAYDALSKLWILLPFDTSGIRRLWDHAIETQLAGVPIVQSQSLSQSFIDKTFQASFRVSPPILSGWQRFLKDQLQTAFPSHSQDDFHKIYRIFDLTNYGTRPPTPREIKLFVNRVGAIHRQWQDAIPLPVQAFYVARTREEHDIGSALASRADQEFLGNVPLEMLTSNWRDCLIAIHFNVPVEGALEVAMENQLKEALLSSDKEKVSTLAQIPGFTAVLEKFVEQQVTYWPARESNNLAMAIGTLAGIREASDQSWTRTWLLLRQATAVTPRWSNFDETVARGILAIAKKFPEADLIQRIAVSLTDSLPKEGEPPKPVDSKHLEPWVKGVHLVLGDLGEAYASIFQSNFRVPGGPQTYLKAVVLAASIENFDNYKRFLIPLEKSEQIIGELAQRVSSATFDEISTTTVQLLNDIDDSWPWPSFVQQAKTRLEAVSANVPPAEVSALVRALYLLSSRVKEAETTLESLTKAGFLAHHLNGVYASDPLAAAACLIAFFEFLPQANLSQHPGQAAAGVNIYRAICKSPASYESIVAEAMKLARKYDKIHSLFEACRRAPETVPFLNSVLGAICKSDKVTDDLSVQVLVNNKDLINNALSPEDFKSLIGRFSTERALQEDLSKMEFSLAMVDLYLPSFQARKDDPRFADFLRSGLKKVVKAEWYNAFLQEDQLLDLVFELQHAMKPVDLSVEFEDAIIDHARKLSTSEVPVPKSKDRWDLLWNAMESFVRDTASRKLFDIVCNATSPLDSLLELYGRRLAAPPIIEYDRDRLSLGCLTLFIERMRIIELKWMHNVLITNPDFLIKLTDSTYQNLRERLFRAAEKDNQSADVKETVDEIIALVNEAGATSKPRKSQSENPESAPDTAIPLPAQQPKKKKAEPA